jgi:Tn3 transposase DDE domain
VRPKIHHTDSHGSTHQIFGLRLLGLSLQPRLAKLRHQRLFKLNKDRNYGALEPLFEGSVSPDLIREQWEGSMRMISSLRNRHAAPDAIVQRLANAGSADRLAKALTGIGKVEKSIDLSAALAARPGDARRYRTATQSWRASAKSGPMVLFCQPRGIPGRRLRGDYEQSELPEPDLECGPVVEYDSDPTHRGGTAAERKPGSRRGSGASFTAPPGPCDSQRKLTICPSASGAPILRPMSANQLVGRDHVVTSAGISICARTGV